MWTKAEPLTHRTLWDSLPENWLAPLGEVGTSRRTQLYLDHQVLHPDPHPLVSVPVVYFPPWVISAADGRTALASYLEAFPGAPPCHSYYLRGRERDSEPDFSGHADGWGQLVMSWELPAGGTGSLEERLGYLRAMTRPYDGGWWLFPAAGAAGRSLHALMAWWAVVYTLSMLARYQPAEWAAHIDIDASRHAVAIESLLKRAMSVDPALIGDTIDQVAGPT